MPRDCDAHKRDWKWRRPLIIDEAAGEITPPAAKPAKRERESVETKEGRGGATMLVLLAALTTSFVLQPHPPQMEWLKRR